MKLTTNTCSTFKVTVKAVRGEKSRAGGDTKTVGKWDSLQFSLEMMPLMDEAASGLICICWGESGAGAEALQIANQSRPRRLTAILTGCLHRAHSRL